MSTNNRQQKIREVLSGLEITSRESDVFCVLLERGVSTAAGIAKQLRDIPRTSIYDVLKTLQHQGLVSSFERDEETYYRVENIEHTIDIIEEQKRDLTEKQNTIRSAVDIFNQFKSGTAYEPGIRFFDGKKGVLAIHRELQNARSETRTIVDITSVQRIFPRMVFEDNLKDFQTFKIVKKDLMIKSSEAERYLKVAPVTEFHRVKWLPPSTQFKTDTLIWPGHVAIIDYSEHLSGIVIDNPTIAETFVAWFEMMWNSIKEELPKTKNRNL
ncbi:MAG: helix-turn-helix domain-containing protein [Candidatus Uhrbacteria bacterium]